MRLAGVDLSSFKFRVVDRPERTRKSRPTGTKGEHPASATDVRALDDRPASGTDVRTLDDHPAAGQDAAGVVTAQHAPASPGTFDTAPGNRPVGEPGSEATLAGLTDQADLGLVVDLLHEVIDPEVGVNIVDLGLVYGLRIADDALWVRMTLTTPGCPLGGYIDDEIRRALWGLPGIADTHVDLIWDPPWGTEMMSDEGKRELGWIA